VLPEIQVPVLDIGQAQLVFTHAKKRFGWIGFPLLADVVGFFSLHIGGFERACFFRQHRFSRFVQERHPAGLQIDLRLEMGCGHGGLCVVGSNLRRGLRAIMRHHRHG